MSIRIIADGTTPVFVTLGDRFLDGDGFTKYMFVKTLLRGETLPCRRWPAYADDEIGCVVPDYREGRLLGAYLRDVEPGDYCLIQLCSNFTFRGEIIKED
jgi:hypothetical protein